MPPPSPSLDSLRARLSAAGIDLSLWGRDGAKRLIDLQRELVAGESRLLDAPLRRRVEVVEVWIARGDRVLIELEQGMADGRRRARRSPPSEKLHPGEAARDGALRCLREELGVEPGQVTLGAVHPPRLRAAISVSYPGLSSVYRLHRVEARVDGLPDEPFETDEAGSNPHDPVRVHAWDWVAPSVVQTGA